MTLDEPTRQQLNAINRDFYTITAQEFDESRGRAWQGWNVLLEHLPPPQANPVRVLDVGCGNGRFGLFLANKWDVPMPYHAMDNNPALLRYAAEALAGRLDATFEERDVAESPPDMGAYDLVVAFGLLHHIPGAEARQAFVRALGARVAPGGYLVYTCWRFYEFERFRERIVAWPDDLERQVERHDYLLDWRRGEPALRYCHYVDDAEQAALDSATGLLLVARYRADGFIGTVNAYSVFRKGF